MDSRSKIQIKLDALGWYFLLRFYSKKLPIYLITEFPKSGGTWLGQMTSNMLNLTFPRNQGPKYNACVMHGHFKYQPYYHKPIVLFRDGRDIMISAYFHYLFENEYNIPWAVKKYRDKLKFKDFEDIYTNLPPFINFMFTHEKLTWSEFYYSWKDKPSLQLKYEDILRDTPSNLLEISKYLEINITNEEIEKITAEFSFENQKAKINSNGKSFLRKGVSGDWKNHFNKEAKELFNHYAGKELIALDYEKSNNWVYE